MNGNAIVIHGIATQPALMASTIMVQQSESYDKYRNDTLVALCPISNGHTWAIQSALVTKKQSNKVEYGYFFEGSFQQTKQVMNHLAGEHLAKNVFEKRIGKEQAKALMRDYAGAASANWQVPLVVTGDRIFCPPLPFECDDPEADQGPSFDYYRQDWDREVMRGRHYIENEYDEIFMESAEKLNVGEFYPAQFVALHRRCPFDDNGQVIFDPRLETETTNKQGMIDVWDFCALSPYHVHHLAIYTNLQMVAAAHRMTHAMFLREAVETDPAQAALRDFNRNHYTLLCDVPSRALEDATRAEMYDTFFGSWQPS